MAVSSNDTIKYTLCVLEQDKDGRDDWRVCGEEICQNLHICHCHLNENTRLPTSIATLLKTVLTQSHLHLQKVHHSKVEREWRRVYTDAAILLGIVALKQCKAVDISDERRQVIIRDAIQTLDIAIVQCGAPGHDRLDLIQGIIASLQKYLIAPLYPEPFLDSVQGEGEKRAIKDVFCLASKKVDEIATLPNLNQYLQTSHREPFVVRKYASEWAALRDENHRWANGKYLEKVAGPARVVPVEIGRSYLDQNWTQAILPWSDFLHASGWAGEANSTESVSDRLLYLAQHDLFRQFPALEKDIEIPDIIYACPPPTSEFPKYRPPVDEDGIETFIKNAWIGPKGTTSPPHIDPYYNAYVQVVGQKLVWIAPPDIISKSHCPIDGNTLNLAVFESVSKGSSYADMIERDALNVLLLPGDLLVMPPGWFHGMRSLTRSFSVSMWY